MTYGTSHLLIGGGYFQREGQENILLCKGGGGHYMKNKNIGRGCVLSTQPDQQKKAPMQKCAKNAKRISKIENFSSFVSLTRHFTKFIFLEQLTAHAPVQYAKYVVFIFIFSKQSS